MSNSEIVVAPVITQLRPYPQSIAPNQLVCSITHNATKATVSLLSSRDNISYRVEIDALTADQTTTTHLLVKGTVPKTSSHVQVIMTDDAISFMGINVKSEVIDGDWIIQLQHPTYPIVVAVFNTLVPTIESDGSVKELERVIE